MSDGTQNKIRIWHAGRDAYHCAFRMMRLLHARRAEPTEFERLRILDAFLLAPSLLHQISMSRELKSQFKELGVPHPDEIFEKLPSVAAVYQDLRFYQSTAASYLAARGILDGPQLRTGIANLVPEGLPDEIATKIEAKYSHDSKLVRFIATQLAKVPLQGADNIYRRAGLPGGHALS